jgi:GNAT superfamily N-acetyltransferase
MDRTAAIESHREALASFVRVIGSGDTSRVIARDGVTAAVVPEVPDRSVVNSVAYRDVAGLRGVLDDLADTYEDAGVSAWTVWVPEDDTEAVALLERARHRLDAAPMAMVLDLALLPAPDTDELDWDAQVAPRVLGRINDLAYGWPVGTFGAAMSNFGEIEGLRLYQARVDGEPVCVLGTYDDGDDCGIYFVATLEEHRGKGLARRLLHRALAEARERGLATSNLQSTTKGYPVYERLGYAPICRLEMWERRR